MKEEYTHIPPNPLVRHPHHRFLIERDGKRIGYIEYRYYSKPFPFFFIRNFIIEPDVQEQGHGRKALQYLNAFLKEKGKAGVLIDGIDYTSPARGMYERYGWQRIPSSLGTFTYNLPTGADVEKLRAILNIEVLTNSGRASAT